MRIATRLAVNYLVVLGLVGLLLAAAVPRIVQRGALAYAGRLLERQALLLAERSGELGGLRGLVTRGSSRLLLSELLMVDAGGQVVFAAGRQSLQQLQGARLPAPLDRMFRQALASGRPVSQATEVAGARRIVAVAPIPSARRAEASAVIVLQLIQELEGVRNESGRQVLLVTLGGVVLALLVSGLIAADLVHRLRHLRTAAVAIAGGDLGGRVPVQGGDEVADVADSFNHMADRVQHLVDGLRRSEQQRRDLVGSLAHELRTPVTSMRGFAEALRDGVVKDPEQQQRYYGIIAAESARLGRLIQDLFDLSKAEAGQLELRLQPLAMTSWLREFAAAAHPGLADRGHTLELVLPQPPPAGGGPALMVDRVRLEQVLHNLLDNAARHSPAGAPLRLELALLPGQVRIGVADQGPGVPPDEAERLWDRFYRSQSGQPGGAGLGLAIVKSLVTAHGGEVGLDSQPGAGARFWFSLPLGQA